MIGDAGDGLGAWELAVECREAHGPVVSTLVPLHDSMTISSTTCPRCEWVVIEDIDSCGCDHLPVVS